MNDRAPVVDYSKAPAPRKLETPPTSTIVVVGDSMADWLGYGLDETYADQPDTGVVREIRATAGLIRYDPKSEQLDWPAVIKDQLATEKPNVIIVMLGLNDRIAIRDGAPAKDADQTNQDKSAQEKAAQEKAAQEKAAQEKAAQGKEEKATAPGAAPSAAAAASQPAVADSTAQHPVPGRSYDFHTDQWAELYVKRIDAMIAALKSKGVPVLWVGLPALRGPKSTSDMAYLDELYRERAERAGIYYVDIWDGFTDDQGRYAVDGPDFEGQIRRLRTADGVHFTKAGAVKLASYVDQELRRVMSNHAAPIVPARAGVAGQARRAAARRRSGVAADRFKHHRRRRRRRLARRRQPTRPACVRSAGAKSAGSRSADCRRRRPRRRLHLAAAASAGRRRAAAGVAVARGAGEKGRCA